MKQVTIYSDGACERNPGPGGWAAVLIYEGHRREISGAEPATTNNRMEMRAALEALRALKERCEVSFWTDSEYLRQGISGWIQNWKRRGWRTKTKEPVKNEDLWRALDEAAARHKVEWHWVKGHSGHEHNERCDRLAVEAIARLKQRVTAAELKAALKEFAEGKRAGERSEPASALLDGLRPS